jgi:ADP-heptose:LPS heptosyltransferase
MPETSEQPAHTWINPIGGYGDMLMLSGVLKQVHDRDPARMYNLVRRTNYLAILKDHPAIAAVGHPPQGACFKRMDYWAMDKLGGGLQRPYQILAREFGLPTPIDESLYIPGDIDEHDPLLDLVPWGKTTIAIAPASDSPRKVMAPGRWHELTDLLRTDGYFVLQVGRLNDVHIRNAFSLLGLTTPHQLLPVLKKCTLVITSDNFIMHAAHMLGQPAVVLWGATLPIIYGYPEHTHIQMPRTCSIPKSEECISPKHSKNGLQYGTPCPENEDHCMNKMSPTHIMETVLDILTRN